MPVVRYRTVRCRRGPAVRQSGAGGLGAKSDADIALLLRGQPGPRADAAVEMAGMAFDVLLETGMLVDPVPLSKSEWNHPERFSNPHQ